MADRYYPNQLSNCLQMNYSFYSQGSAPDPTSIATGTHCNRSMDENRMPIRYFNNQNFNMNMKAPSGLMSSKFNGAGQNYMNANGLNSTGTPSVHYPGYGGYGERTRFAPYYNNRASYAPTMSNMQYFQQYNAQCYGPSATSCYPPSEHSEASFSTTSSSGSSGSGYSTGGGDQGNQPVTLQINNLDYSLDENNLRNFLLNQLKPITPVLALTFEGNSYVKVTVPNIYFAKQVVSNLHRKKIGHKRMVVSYTRDSSSTEINTLRCQVAGLLKDVPYCTLSMCKFRELFQSRFKASISVLDLYKMQDICDITTDKNDEKYITLHADLANSIETSPLMECLQHSVPYCTTHFKREQHKGWAEQEIEQLPNVFMTISEIQAIIYPLLKNHTGDIPVASLVHCIRGELGISVTTNDNGVNLEHLICCVHGIQITTNNFGIKILGWLEPENVTGKDPNDGRFYLKSGTTSDPLYQISREVIELVKMSPKSTMKFNRFIPAYHNHFGKQCRVADYGYTKLIELFEALSSVVQIMGDGENRQITLHHRAQVRRFTADLLRILRAQANKSVLLSQLPSIFVQTQNRKFDITDYGVCDIVDILDGLVNSNTVVITKMQTGNEILISIPKRKQTQAEIEKTCVFGGEVVELFRSAAQYSILFQKFVRSYHYHFGYQCRLSDYGYLKLADLIEAIQGVVEIESTSDEDKRIHLSAIIAQRIFAEQLEDLVSEFTGCAQTCVQFDEVLQLHKKKFGYQIQPLTLGVDSILDAVNVMPYVELLDIDNSHWIICHKGDPVFRNRCYRACKIIEASKQEAIPIQDMINVFSTKYEETLSETNVAAMKHLIQVNTEQGAKYVSLTGLMKFLNNIVRLLEQRYMMVFEIKTTLNLGITDCCRHGYPNLYSLLRAYPDIFVVDPGPSQERSEVGLVAQGDCASKSALLQSQGSTNFKHEKPTSVRRSSSDRLLQALVPLDNKPNCIDVLASQIHSKQNRRGSGMYSSASYQNNKENAYNNTMNASMNSSMSYDPNTSSGSTGSYGCGPGSSHHAGLWNRRQERNFRSNLDLTDMNCMTLPMYQYYAPPKPDTPSTDKMPFWIDPVWASRNGENSPRIDSFNGNLPLNILPMLMSPYTLSKSENMKQMFSFDHPDKILS